MEEEDHRPAWIPVLEAPVRWPQRRWLEAVRRRLYGPVYDEPPCRAEIARWRGEHGYEVSILDRHLNEWCPDEWHPDIETAKDAAARLVGSDRLGHWTPATAASASPQRLSGGLRECSRIPPDASAPEGSQQRRDDIERDPPRA